MILLATAGLAAFYISTMMLAVWITNRFRCRWDTTGVRKEHPLVVAVTPELEAISVWDIFSRGWPDPDDSTVDVEHLEVYERLATTKATWYGWASRTAAAAIGISLSVVLSVLGSMWAAGQWEPTSLLQPSSAAPVESPSPAMSPAPSELPASATSPAEAPLLGISNEDVGQVYEAIDEASPDWPSTQFLVGVGVAFVAFAIIGLSVYSGWWQRAADGYRRAHEKRLADVQVRDETSAVASHLTVYALGAFFGWVVSRRR